MSWRRGELAPPLALPPFFPPFYYAATLAARQPDIDVDDFNFHDRVHRRREEQALGVATSRH